MSKAKEILTEMQNWSPEKKNSEVLSMNEYLSKVLDPKNKYLTDLAHARIYHMIEQEGVEFYEDEDGESRPKYNFFEKEIYGLKDTLEKLVNLFHSGGRLLPARKRIAMLMGPVGGGKSTIATILKKGLENYTQTPQGEIYSIVDCPLHEDPLHALPEKFRKDIKAQHNIYIEGKLCPVCQLKLDNDFQGDFREFKIEQIYFSEQRRKGIGTFLPGDVKSQDIAELIGSINLSKIADIGIESDPRAFVFDGELNVANRGLIELIEMLKADEKFLYVFLTLAQENVIKAPKFPLIYEDMVILAHTNETEWEKFMRKPENEALKDRIITILCPYVLEMDNERKIYEKEWGNSNDAVDVIIAPRTFDLCAAFAILSRLAEPSDKRIDLVKKMKAYNGEEIEGLKRQEIRDMKQNAEREGMFGIGPRYIMNAISKAATDAREEYSKLSQEEKIQMCFGIDETEEYGTSVDAIDMMKTLSEMIDQDPELNNNEKDDYKKLLEMAREELDKNLKEDIQKAFCYEFEQEAEILFTNYLNNVIAFINKEKMKDPITGRDIDPDEKLMKSVESMIHVSEGAKEQHRQTIVNRFSRASNRGKTFDFSTYPELREAITALIFEQRKDTIQITTTALHPDKDKLSEINRVIKRLIELGYTPFSAAKMIRYVGQLLNR